MSLLAKIFAPAVGETFKGIGEGGFRGVFRVGEGDLQDYS